MDNRQNIMAMMGLGAAIVALGATLVSSEFFTNERPEKMGYVVEGVEAGAESGPAAAPVAIATLLPTADAAKGAEVFKKCASCHMVTQGGAAGVGPNLYGIVGKKHGYQAGFAYSDALLGKAGPWTFEALNEWLTSPKAYAPGTKMSFAGLSKPEDRANLLVYLNAQGSNLPLPAAPAADAAPAEAAGNATEAVANATAPAANATQAAKK
jgi:cytochrome c